MRDDSAHPLYHESSHRSSGKLWTHGFNSARSGVHNRLNHTRSHGRRFVIVAIERQEVYQQAFQQTARIHPDRVRANPLKN